MQHIPLFREYPSVPLILLLMELELILTELRPFELSHFAQFLQLCNQLLPQFSMDDSQTWQTYCGHNADMHIGF